MTCFTARKGAWVHLSTTQQGCMGATFKGAWVHLCKGARVHHKDSKSTSNKPRSRSIPFAPHASAVTGATPPDPNR